MTRLVVIASLVLLIGAVTANVASSDSQAVAKGEAKAEAEASSGAQDENDDDEECNDDDNTEDVTTTTEPPKLVCGDGEEVDNCPVYCPTDYCPTSEQEARSPKNCPRPKKCPPPQCKCGFNRRRAANGTCIKTRDCPPFECSEINQVYNSCPPLCPTDDCSQASPSGECPKQFGNILIVLECAPTCRCKEGYWKKNGVCVPYDECDTPECGDNEILSKCPANCPSQNCPKSEAETKLQCSQPAVCPPPACECRINFRRAENGICIPTRNCPPFECSRPNEEYNSCPPWCPSDDCSQASPEGQCPKLFGRIGVRLICSPKCRCRKGYWRKDGVCVPYAECRKPVKPTPLPECSGPNEEYTQELQTCPPQECNSLVARIDCRNAPPPQPGCACKNGFTRLNSTSPCMPVCKCPQMLSSSDCKVCTRPNEEFNLVKPSCPPETCISMRARYDCSKFPPPAPGCACKSGFLRQSEDSECIPTSECT